MMNLNALALASALLSGPGQEPSAPRVTIIPAKEDPLGWKGYLKRATDQAPTAVLLDVNVRRQLPRMDIDCRGLGLYELLAGSLGRELWTKGGILVAHRPDPQIDSLVHRSSLLVKWLTDLSPEDVRRLSEGKYDSAKMDPAVRRSVARALGGESGPMLRRGLTLRAAVTLNFEGKEARRKPLTIELEPGYESGPMFKGTNPFEDLEPLSSEPDVAVPGLGEGALAFEEGELLTVGELLAKAKAIFERDFVVDPLWKPVNVYIRGRFERTGFESAIHRLTTLDPVASLPLVANSDELTRLANGPLRSMFDRVGKASTLRTPVTMTLVELAQANPEILSEVARLDLPGDARVRVRPAFKLFARTPVEYIKPMTLSDGTQSPPSVHATSNWISITQ